jgi:hypothetical protein
MSRTSSPLLFGLAPRGVFRALAIAGQAVGSYSTFSPLPAVRALRDVSQVFLRDATVLRSAGGLIFCGTIRGFVFSAKPPGVTRRVVLSRVLANLRWPRLRTVSGLSSRRCTLQRSSQRLPSPPARFIITANFARTAAPLHWHAELALVAGRCCTTILLVIFKRVGFLAELQTL